MLYFDINRFVISRAAVNMVVKMLQSKTVTSVVGYRGLGERILGACTNVSMARVRPGGIQQMLR